MDRRATTDWRAGRWVLIALLCFCCAGPLHAAEPEPALPAGLADDEPELPAGLGDEGEPGLPTGLEAPTTQPTSAPAEEPAPPKWLELTGFWEVRGGVRTQHDSREKHASIGETRLQLETEKSWAAAAEPKLKLVADFLYDPALDHHTVRLERGTGWLDLREASLSLTPLKFMDLKLGRQALTWGTGDLVFINDLFPKDWQAFFIGRDVEYLKAPSDAIKVSLFSDLANVDVVYTPAFDPDRHITGRRLSYHNAALGRRAGRDAMVDADVPNEWFDDQEWALRISRNLAGYELAAYGYWGYWKSPAGMDRRTGRATSPRLSVYGGSARGPFARGIGNLEFGYYDSRQDRGGDDPFVSNSQLRLLGGYQQDLQRVARDLTVGAQYYLERTLDHAALARNAPPGAHVPEPCRHVVTVRVTKLLLNQNLTLSLFAFYSPSDSDAYVRPLVQYKIDDHWTAEMGGNVFFGADEHTFFSQFQGNSNVYVALRYGF